MAVEHVSKPIFGIQYHPESFATEGGKKGFGRIPSEMEGAKLTASVFFFDLGITDSITDKHRTYAATFVVPVK